jgi:thiamine-phosphate pyrophosphorylase
MELHIISNPGPMANEHKLITALFELGMVIFHLRKPGLSSLEVESIVQEIPAVFHNRIIIHYYPELVVKYKLKGVHLNQSNIGSYGQTTHIPCIKGYSAHSLTDITDCKDDFDYFFISPVFDSISKKGYPSSFNLVELKSYLLKNSFSRKIIALGGIDTNSIRKAKELGFGGAAALGYIWEGLVNENRLEDQVRAITEKYLRLVNSIN